MAFTQNVASVANGGVKRSLIVNFTFAVNKRNYMKIYTADDITVLKWDDAVKRNPKIYFGEEVITPQSIIEIFEYVAPILGAKHHHSLNIDGWWYFCADLDWIFQSTYPIGSIEKLFSQPLPFPEAKTANTFRLEALSLIYCTDLYTYSNPSKDIVVLKGTLPQAFQVEQHIETLQEWPRVIGFKFDH